MANEIKLNGRVLVKTVGRDVPLRNIRIDLKEDLAGYGLLGSGITDYDGQFSIMLSEQIGALHTAGTIRITAFVYEGPQLLHQQVITSLEVAANILITGTAYNNAVSDNTRDEEKNDQFFVVYGTLKMPNGVAVPNRLVEIREAAYGTGLVFTTTETDLRGRYEVKVSLSQMNNFKILGKPMISVHVPSHGYPPVAVSENTYVESDRVEINLIANGEVVTPLSEYDEIEGLVNELMGFINWQWLKVDRDNVTRAVANMLGKPLQEMDLFFKAKLVWYEWEFEAAYVFALFKALPGAELQDIVQLNSTRAAEILSTAVEKKIIGPQYEAGIGAAVVFISNFMQRASTYNAKIQKENTSLGNILDATFQNPTLREKLIDRLNDFNETDIKAFWQQLAADESVGETQANLAKRSLQLLGITGFQPEVTRQLLSLSPSDLPVLARFTIDDWKGHINTASANAGRQCVPLAISTAFPADPVTAYATKLRDIVQELYPLSAISGKLQGTEGTQLIPDAGKRLQVRTFINNNPGFDLRVSSVHDINAEDHNLTGITDVKELRAELAPFQRLMRITGGKPEAMTALKIAGISSAQDIASMPASQFTAQFGTVFAGGQTALTAYTTAVQISAIAAQVITNIQINEGGILATSPTWNPTQLGPSASPELRALFGSLDHCGCEYCMSVYSPSAYFVDILNFLKQQSDGPLYSAYDELLRRRPDLVHIDLTCKNANTALPYVDLVNELLERLVLKLGAPAQAPLSYQTQGSTQELAAYPEHKERITVANGPDYHTDNTAYQYVYDTVLKNAVFTHELPFSLGLEESRLYFKHLGLTRHNLRYLLELGFTEEEPTEWLGLNSKQVSIINAAGSYNTDHHRFYRFSSANVTDLVDPADSTQLISGVWTDVLQDRVDVLLQQAQISYKELLQLLTTRVLNHPIAGVRPVVIVAHDGEPAETCDLSKLKLQIDTTLITAELFFSKLHRFIRLYRKAPFTIYDLDRILFYSNVGDINANIVCSIARLCSDLSLTLDQLFGMAVVDTHHYINYDSERQDELPSMYDRIFRNKSVLNPPNPAFANPAALPANYINGMTTITAACGITEPEVRLILEALNVDPDTAPVTLPHLGVLYSVPAIARSLGLDVEAYLSFFGLIPQTLTSYGQVNALYSGLSSIVHLVHIAADSAFSLDELHFLLRNAYVPGLGFNEKDVWQFHEELRRALVKVLDSDTAPQNIDSALTNVIIQKYSEEFELDTADLLYLLDESLKMSGPNGAQPALDALHDQVWIRSTFGLSREEYDNLPPGTELPSFYLEELYTTYSQIWKQKLVFRKLGTGHAFQKSLRKFFSLIGFTVDVFDFLAVTTALTDFRRVIDWYSVKKFFDLSDEMFDKLLTAIAANDRDEFLSAFDTSLQPALKQLFGDPGVPGDFGWYGPVVDAALEPEKVLRAGKVTDVMSSIGLTVQQLTAALQPEPALTASQNVRNAAKSRYREEEWLKIARPLQDVLREKQRKALVDFLLSTPQTTGSNVQLWRNENELFAHLLIDVEMSPCMKTSRIKQGISSVQLFLDRLIMNLEFENYDRNKMITISTDAIEQWKEWRKWYRIWEANRKIFLYPENWIEPELRDDKTPFFEELETQLLQDEVTADKVEGAYYEYLEKLDEAARLEPVTAYHEYEPENDVDIVYVISRTYAQPHRYYYRRLENEEWSPWEKVNIDVKGDHVRAVVWNRRLHLFWLTFLERKHDADVMPVVKRHVFAEDHWVNRIQADKNSVDLTLTSFMDDYRSRYWNIMVNWSEYKEGKWLAPKVGKDVMELSPLKVRLTTKNKQSYGSFSNTEFRAVYDRLSKKQEIKVHELFRNRLYLEPVIDENEVLTLSLMFCGGLDEHYYGLHAFVFEDSSADPYVLRHSDRGFQFLAPRNTFTNNMKFVQTPLPVTAANKRGSLNTDGYGWTNVASQILPMDPGYTSYFIYHSNTLDKGYNIPAHVSDAPILETSPYAPFAVTGRSDMRLHGQTGEFHRKPMEQHFFYEDKVNTFFIRKKAEEVVRRRMLDNIKDQDHASIGLATAVYESFYPGTVVNTVEGGGQVLSSYTPAVKELIPTAYEDRYYFQTFYHPHIHRFIKRLNKDGLDGLLQLDAQDPADTMDFKGQYDPTTLVYKGGLDASGYPLQYPKNHVDFDFRGTYSRYNWELFFHIPMIVAQRLSDNQQFEEAQKWFHYIFNPTSNVDGSGQFSGSSRRFWKFRPFYDEAGKTIVTVNDLMAHINQYAEQIRAWEEHPFQPHRIARMRLLAYMKNVLMKYLDNLIAWGDQLFRRDTIESINEATQLYILAANILGERPQDIARRTQSEYTSFQELISTGTLDAFSNAMVDIENFLGPNAAPAGSGTGGSTAPLQMRYFCLPQNDKLLTYWDTIADRLFKIRNCRNIEGTVRELPLYEPPIDPALLVRAAAMGIDINTVLDDAANIGMPHYRFSYMLQKANELCNDVRGLGSELLSALEKKDAEHMALLRSGHELKLLEQVRSVKEAQVSEAEQSLESLILTKENTEIRLQYYSSRPYMNRGEKEHLASLETGLVLQAVQGAFEGTAGVLSAIPTAHMQAPGSGISVGGLQFANVMRAASVALGISAGINSTKGSMAATKGSYDRRRDDWNFQIDTAKKELEQLAKQILGAEIRLDIAKRDLANHELQMEQTTEADQYMRSKFTNKELYSWMVAQLAATYFQSYQLAYDLAKKAQKCMKYELPLVKEPAEGFVKFGYWDSLKKGLLTAEKLQFDLRKMEAAYMEENKREFELTKHVSLALLDPAQLLELRQSGTCTFSVPEELFDMDYAGHYLRRIKSVSLSIPCVAGPYTTVSCKLTQGVNKYRKDAAPGATYEESPGGNDPRFVYPNGVQAIATSTGQNDAGVFELNFRDERYLPFEGTGAVSRWTLEFPGAVRQFDFDTITDVILHIRYTARESAVLKESATTHFNTVIANAGNTLLSRYFSLKYEFANEWYAYGNAFATRPGTYLNLRIDDNAFPYYCKGKRLLWGNCHFRFRTKQALVDTYKLYIVYQQNGEEQTTQLTLNSSGGYGGSVNVPIEIAGNSKILKLKLRKVGPGGVETAVSMDSLLDDLYIVVSFRTQALVSSAPDDEVIEYELPSGAAAWWKADEGVGVTSGQVVSWADQSGNNVHLNKQAANGPTLDAAGKNGIKPLVFNGAHSLYTGAYNDSNSATYVVLVNVDTTSSTGIVGRNAQHGNAAGLSLWIYGDGICPMSTSPATTLDPAYLNLLRPINTGKWEVWHVCRNAVTGRFSVWRNGVEEIDVSCGNTFLQTSRPVSVGSLGTNNFGNFKMLELALYDRALTDVEIAESTRYLKEKYDL